jgi:RNA polymerase sigma-70 factor, ECF subfamily
MNWETRMASTQSTVTEEMQIRLVLGGDAGAFCELIRPYRRRLYLKTLSIVGNDADAEEVIQNAFLKAFNKISQFRREASFYTWLFSITVNEARMWLRSSRRHVHESLDDENGERQLVREIADSREGPFEALERKQIRCAIRKALRLLSASHREVVVLRDLELYSISETAKLLATSEINVRSRLRRGRVQLRRALEHLRTSPLSTTSEPGALACDSNHPSWPQEVHGRGPLKARAGVPPGETPPTKGDGDAHDMPLFIHETTDTSGAAEIHSR